MSTFLELCQDLARQSGVRGTANVPVPSAVLGQTGELDRIVDWTKKAWRRIQADNLWDWQWENAALTLPIGESRIVGTIPESRYLVDTASRSFLTSDGLDLGYVPWDEFRDVYSRKYIANGNPTAWTVLPDHSIQFNGTASLTNFPSTGMDFTVERYKLPTDLMADGDVPGMPADLHDLITYTALILYANFDEAGVVRQTAIDERARLEQQLLDRCLPRMRLGGPITDC